MKALILGATLAFWGAAAQAACPDVSLMHNAARGWIAGQRVPDPLVWNMDDARCAYDSFRSILQAEMGPPVGIKVAFTEPDLRRRYGINEPVAGAFFAPMLVADRTRLSMRGSRNPVYQADLVVTVGSAAIMQARTRDDVVAALRDVRPFIELPDIAMPRGVAPTGPMLAAYGAVPWRGVLGTGIAFADLADPVGDLAALTAAIKVDGKTVGTGRGVALLGHPLDVVLWLIEDGGYDLKPGSIISLGSLAGSAPAQAGHVIEAEYNLAGRPMNVSVTLVP